MSGQTVKRKSQNARQVAGAQSNARKVRSAKAKGRSLFSEFLSWVPLSEKQLHKVFMAGIISIALLLALVVASAAGVPALLRNQVATIASSTGFEVRRVEVRGVKRLNELKVYERALAQQSRAMPLVDVDGLRSELMDLSWVADARVSRQLPDTLVIDIVEREPHAVLRLTDKMVLIDATGHHLEPISQERAKGKLILSGPQAGKQVERLTALLEAAPALKPQVREASWTGNRRWNLTFRTGQVLALPEGSKPSAEALIAFARLDGTNRLLGGKVAAFDMRSPDRIYLRIPGRSEEVPPAKLATQAATKPDTKAAEKPKISEKQQGDKN